MFKTWDREDDDIKLIKDKVKLLVRFDLEIKLIILKEFGFFN